MNCDVCGGIVRIVSLHGVTGINRLHQCVKCLACWPYEVNKPLIEFLLMKKEQHTHHICGGAMICDC